MNVAIALIAVLKGSKNPLELFARYLVESLAPEVIQTPGTLGVVAAALRGLIAPKGEVQDETEVQQYCLAYCVSALQYEVTYWGGEKLKLAEPERRLDERSWKILEVVRASLGP